MSKSGSGYRNPAEPDTGDANAFYGTWSMLQSDRSSETCGWSCGRSNISPFGHQMRICAPAMVHDPSFGASMLTGPTQSAPSFTLFLTVVTSAEAELQERTSAAAIA